MPFAPRCRLVLPPRISGCWSRLCSSWEANHDEVPVGVLCQPTRTTSVMERTMERYAPITCTP
eukprot:5433427-Pyramimonas_sp.AAC.1